MTVKILWASLNRLKQSNLFKFLLANALYSLSTALISIISPILYTNTVYESYIYIYQMVLFITGVTTAGLVPALLRYYKIDNRRYVFYYYFTSSIIFVLLLLIGCFPNNALYRLLNLNPTTSLQSLIITGSVISSLIFIFNRGFQTARESYNKIFNSVIIIFLLRLISLFITWFFSLENVYIILILTCILPFSYEIFTYISDVCHLKKADFKYYKEFLICIFKVSFAGVIFLLTSRLYVISSKDYDDSIAAALSFAASFTGIISILNTTFTSYFIGKLDHRDPESIGNYLINLKTKAPLFIFISIILSGAVSVFVYAIYPSNSLFAAFACFVTVFQSALVSYLGMVTLLAKTYNLVHLQIAQNTLTYLIVLFFVQLYSRTMPEYISFTVVNIIIVLSEFLLACWILLRIKTLRKI